MKNIFFIFILLFSFQIGHAQRPDNKSRVKISAKVLDELSETPLEYATATLFSTQDSSVVTGSITDTTDSFIQRIKRINTDGTTTVRPENLAIENAYGAEFIFSLTPKKWFHFSGNFNFYRSIIDGTSQGAQLESDSYSWFAQLTSKFTFLDDT